MGNEMDEGNFLDLSHNPTEGIADGYEIPEEVRDIDLTNNRIAKIEKLDHCRHLERLVLRQNAIKVFEGLRNLSELVDLDLYMNRIGEVPQEELANKEKLRRLDLSFNEIRELSTFPGRCLTALKELYLINNKVKKIEGLEGMQSLELLELGDNRIRDIENLTPTAGLRSLWLGRNKITKIQGLDCLTNLRILSLQSNRIVEMEGLSSLVHLEEIYLSNNGISKIKGLENCKKLRVLDLGANRVTAIECVSHLHFLEEFWMNDNLLDDLQQLKELRNATNLQTVYLERNPLAKTDRYEESVLALLPPSLTQLDALPVRR